MAVIVGFRIGFLIDVRVEPFFYALRSDKHGLTPNKTTLEPHDR
ncbi:hypothetical protein [Paraburkholderia tropica]|nr:hypothetical protein [Paraburkholderia tropica]